MEPLTGVETKLLISEPIPLDPVTPETIREERQLLEDLKGTLVALRADGWEVRNDNTNRNRNAGPYRLRYTLARARG